MKIHEYVFKITCGKGPCLNLGHWSGGLSIQGLLSTDRCLPDNKSYPEIIRERWQLRYQLLFIKANNESM